jgi:hypothetical protein
MANDNTIKTYSAIDIEKYHNGQLTAREMHAMEKAALDDPFLADALEGYTIPGVNAAADIAELKKRLEERESGNKVIPIAATNKSSFPWFRAAAMFILIAGAAFLVYKFGFNSSDTDNFAKNDSPVATEPKPTNEDKDKSASIIIDSNSNAVTNQNSNYKMPVEELTTDSLFKQKVSGARVEDRNAGRVADHEFNYTLQDSSVVNLATRRSKSVSSETQTFGNATFPPAPKEPAERPKDKYGYYLNQTTSRWDSTANQDNRFFDAEVAKTDDLKKRKQASQNIGIRGVTEKKENFAASTAPAPSLNVFRGRVTDANANALPFANITNTVDNVGTYSDSKGNFTLISPDSVLNVQVRSVGFENNTRLLVAGPRDNQVIMQDDNRTLGEVVIGNSRNANINRSRNNTIVHEEPEPVDGWSNYDIYVANNLNMPDTLKSMPKKGGEVELSFDINKNGEPVNIAVDKSLCESCDKEAIRLLKEGPKWKQKSKRKKRTSVTISF